MGRTRFIAHVAWGVVLLPALAANAIAFNSYTPRIHDDITRAAAKVLNWNDAAIDLLCTRVRDVDWDETNKLTLKPNADYRATHHFDRGETDTDNRAASDHPDENPPFDFDKSKAAFKASASYMRSQRDAAIAALVANDTPGARTAIARGLHALEDFYAHSNYIDLITPEQGVTDEAMWDGTKDPSTQQRLTGYRPGANKPGEPPGDNYGHENYCKDKPTFNAEAQKDDFRGNGKKHDAAKSYAITAAIYFLDQVRDGVAAAEWNAVKVAAVTDLNPSDANYQWAAVQPWDPGGFTVSSHGTTVAFAAGAIPDPRRAGVLGVPSYFYLDGFVDESHGRAADGAVMRVVREIRPEGQVFASPAQATVAFSTSEVVDLVQSRSRSMSPTASRAHGLR